MPLDLTISKSSQKSSSHGLRVRTDLIGPAPDSSSANEEAALDLSANSRRSDDVTKNGAKKLTASPEEGRFNFQNGGQSLPAAKR